MNNAVVHLGIIMDGNRRWAKDDGLLIGMGHLAGAEKVKEVIRWSANRGIKYLTLYTFSTENWQRPKEEVSSLLGLIGDFLKENCQEFQKEGGKLRFLGDRDGLPVDLVKAMEEAELATKDNDRIIVNSLFNYGGRAEILRAVRRIIKEGVKPENINTAEFGRYLYTAGLPDPDLIIRTSGEMRLSNFLTWQSAYSELYFCEKHWPDFSEQDLDKALSEYSLRQRRIGK